MAHLLLIEDAPEVAQVVRILCRRAGHTLAWQTDGAEPSLTLRPDLVLLDLNLQDEDGIAVYRRLATKALRGVTTALFTQGAAPARLAAGLDAGIDFLVSKDLLGRPAEWNVRLGEVLELAARPQVEPPGRRLSPDAFARLLRHPVLLRLGDEVVAALLRRASAVLHLPARSAVDVGASTATLAVYLTHLDTSAPDAVARLGHGLARQVECLLGSEASQPFRDALTAALP